MLFSAAFFFSAVVNFLGMGFSFSSDSDMEDADSELELRVLVTAVFLVLEDDDDFGGLCLPIGLKWNYLFGSNWNNTVNSRIKKYLNLQSISYQLTI